MRADATNRETPWRTGFAYALLGLALVALLIDFGTSLIYPPIRWATYAQIFNGVGLVCFVAGLGLLWPRGDPGFVHGLLGVALLALMVDFAGLVYAELSSLPYCVVGWALYSVLLHGLAIACLATSLVWLWRLGGVGRTGKILLWASAAALLGKYGAILLIRSVSG